ncbi:sigma-54-dependent Fis family transcriptional regulator [Paraburkholderia phenoliruptrix]|uniref:sigma-54-dependent Fis family transcriptional regulator n=1 Tax=Paraburkholderia phenoliruptrix TaxID=252970 RepID=UPI001C4E9BE3|nr:sigma 54-interacting transcriptional regulator [Paraburkholderia phenoliruptrix]MBW0447076.1 sigma 54-interacting transcriptional regulator [Paraburkholderia phenoliruptrix]MBW9101068.1 sigma 54-interacting transcriptional regulator [Paraburkholderia phenoliruptrix]
MTAHDPLDRARADSPHSAALPLGRLCGNDATMLAVLSRARLLIDRQLPILILGETGTGKEYLARALHDYSSRRHASMVSVNCGSIPENLIESELFGYTRGAFSGALSSGMKGKVVLAHRGTLFLDEIGDMPAAQQTRLLRALSEREVTPIGSAEPIAVDLQLICATHQNIESRVEAGTFREDLYYRIAVGIIHLPPVRERHDRAWLLQSILEQEAPGFTLEGNVDSEAREMLLHCNWPGNLRQMRAAIQYACAVKSGELIRACDLPANVQPGKGLGVRREPRASFHATLQAAPPAYATSDDLPHAAAANDMPYAARGARGAPHADIARLPVAAPSERDNILRALSASRWNISAASRELGICRASLYRKLRQFRIPHVRDLGCDMLMADHG